MKIETVSIMILLWLGVSIVIGVIAGKCIKWGSGDNDDAGVDGE